jgi:hypothetical protein
VTQYKLSENGLRQFQYNVSLISSFPAKENFHVLPCDSFDSHWLEKEWSYGKRAWRHLVPADQNLNIKMSANQKCSLRGEAS